MVEFVSTCARFLAILGAWLALAAWSLRRSIVCRSCVCFCRRAYILLFRFSDPSSVLATILVVSCWCHAAKREKIYGGEKSRIISDEGERRAKMGSGEGENVHSNSLYRIMKSSLVLGFLLLSISFCLTASNSLRFSSYSYY